MTKFYYFILLLGSSLAVFVDGSHFVEKLQPSRSISSTYTETLVHFAKPVPNLVDDTIFTVFSELDTFDFLKKNLTNLLPTFAGSGDNSHCNRQLTAIISALPFKSMPWAKKYIDAWAKPPAGLMNGALTWYGDYDECLNIDSVAIPDGSRDIISPKFCGIGFSPPGINATVPNGLLQFTTAVMIGMCVPAVCSEENLISIVSTLIPSNFPLTLTPGLTYCQVVNPPLNNNAYAAIAIFSTVGLLIITGLLFDVIGRIRYWAYSWQKSPTAYSSLTDLVIGDGVPVAASALVDVSRNRLDTQNVNTRLEGGEDDVAAICDGDSASLVLPLPAGNTSSGNGNGGGIETPPENSTILNRMYSKRSGSSVFKRISQVFTCFSPYTNAGKLFTIPSYCENIPNLNCLNAIRVLSILWVILGHTYLFVISSLDNVVTYVEVTKRFTFQFVMSGLFAVDSFFFLSGFLAYWSLSRQLDLLTVQKSQSSKGKLWFWKKLPFIYLHRFLRLTPIYVFIILIDLCLWKYIGNGPFYFQGTDTACQNTWWTNILYINNFVDMDNMCVGWGWYLAVDMQLFIFAPFLIVLFFWRPCWGYIVSFLLLFAQVVVVTILTYTYNLPATLFGPANSTAGTQPPQTNYFDLVYIKPYCRLGPYVVGLVIGHVVVRHSLYLTRSLFSRPYVPTLFWLLCISTMFTLIYGLFGIHSGAYINPTIADAIYNSLARTAWGMVLGWLVLACVANRGGPLGRVLSWPGWSVPARLTYAAYLTHPLILIYYVQTSRRALHGNDITMVFFYCGTIFVTFIFSAIFSLFFEAPVISLQKLV